MLVPKTKSGSIVFVSVVLPDSGGNDGIILHGVELFPNNISHNNYGMLGNMSRFSTVASKREF